MPASASATTRSSMLALIGLLAVAAAWGSSFPLTKALLARMSAVNFNAVRFTLAAIVMLALFARSLRTLGRRGLTLGMLLGVTYGVAQLVQTTGLEHTPASVSDAFPEPTLTRLRALKEKWDPGRVFTQNFDLGANRSEA